MICLFKKFTIVQNTCKFEGEWQFDSGNLSRQNTALTRYLKTPVIPNNAMITLSLITSAKEVMFLSLFVCLPVSSFAQKL